MAYDPYQFSLARANVVGNTISGVTNTLIDTASKVTEIAKQAGINDKIKTAYTDILNKFADEAISRNPGMDRGAALIAARKVYRQPVEGLSAEDNLKLLLSGDVNAQKVLDSYTKMAEENKKKQVQQQGAAAAQRVSGVDRQYTPEVDTGLGFTEATVTSETPAPQYREDAMARYGGLAAEGEVPVQTTKELEQQPSIAALPPRPEPEKPTTAYQQWEMKFKENEAEEKRRTERMSKGGATSKDRDANYRWALDRATDYEAGSKNALSRASAIKRAIIKLKDKLYLDETDTNDLMENNYTGKTDLQTLNQELADANLIVAKSKAAAKKFYDVAKNIEKGMSLTEAGATADYETNRSKIDDAMGYIQTKIAPTFSTMTGSVKQILDQLPPEMRATIEEKIGEVKKRAYAQRINISDSDIVQMLISGKQANATNR